MVFNVQMTQVSHVFDMLPVWLYNIALTQGFYCARALLLLYCFVALLLRYFVTFTILVGACSLLRRFTTVTTACARLMNARPVMLSLSSAAGVPLSPFSQMLCTSGICASNGRLSSFARLLHPSLPKM